MTADQVKDNVAIFERQINAPVAHVYHAITNSVGLTQWLCNFAVSNVRAGGALFLSWNNGHYVTGEFTELSTDKSAVFTWLARGDDTASKVTMTLDGDAESTHITVQHADTTSEKAYDWANALENLQAVVEEGDDLRISRRVILGVVPTNFDADIAKQLGVPVSEGFRISGTVPGTSAEASGLQADDVFVEVNGKTIKQGQDIPSAIAGLGVGDEVNAKIYRGAALKTVKFSLSPMPTTPIPESREAFVSTLKDIYTQLDDELHQLYDGVSEEEATTAPAEGEWSANEVVAHLILTERWMQAWAGSMINGPTLATFSAHEYERAVATAATYESTKSILAEMKRSQHETVKLLENLREEMVARKGTFAAMARMILQMPAHNRNHFEQIRTAIDAARA